MNVRPALALIPCALAAVSCAPAPLYLSAGDHKMARGAVTGGEVPRDAVGEPVWAAIRPMPGIQPQLSAVEAEGDANPDRI